MKFVLIIIILFTNLIFVNSPAFEIKDKGIFSEGKILNDTQQKVIELARLYRVDRSLPDNQEKAREKGILEEACANMVLYKSDDLLSAVKDFLNDNLSIDIKNYEIIDTNETEFFGKSEASVFLIKDYLGRLQYVVKTFPEPRTLEGRFLQEISAIDLVQELKLANVVPLQQLAFGLCLEKNNKEWGLLLETPASGKRMDQFVQELAQKEQSSPQRMESLELAKKAFKRLGTGLAHLHSTKAPTLTSIPPILVEKSDQKLATVLSNPFVMNELTKRMDLSEFINYVQGIRNSSLSVTLHYTYVHGDAHLGNSFYDEVNDQCCFIDLAGMHRSIDIKGEPILHGTIDLVRVEDSLRFKSLNILTNEEVNALHVSFYEGYQEAGGKIPEKQLFDFYNMYVKLRRLASKSGYIDEEDPRIQASDKLIFEDAISYFEKQIN